MRVAPVAQAASLIFTHISEHAKLEIPMDLRDLRAFSPPRPASETADLVICLVSTTTVDYRG